MFEVLASSTRGRVTEKVSGSCMDATLTAIDVLMTRLEHLAEALPADPNGHVRRSAAALRTTFAARGAIEPAIARVRDSVDLLQRGDRDGSRNNAQRQPHGVDDLQEIVEEELLPALRRLGFEV